MSELSQIVVTDANGVRRHVNYALEGDGSLTRTTILADGTEVALSSENLAAIVAAIQEERPLPDGAATDATLATIRDALEGTLSVQLSGSTIANDRVLVRGPATIVRPFSHSGEVAPSTTVDVIDTDGPTWIQSLAYSCGTDFYVRLTVSSKRATGTLSDRWNALPRNGVGGLPASWFPSNLRPFEGRHPDWILYDDDPEGDNYGVALVGPKFFPHGVTVQLTNTAGATPYSAALTGMAFTES